MGSPEFMARQVSCFVLAALQHRCGMHNDVKNHILLSWRKSGISQDQHRVRVTGLHRAKRAARGYNNRIRTPATLATGKTSADWNADDNHRSPRRLSP
jgi:hypothetical protein